MIEAYIKMWKNGLNFSGRTRRRDYWYPTLVSITIGLALYLLMKSLSTIYSVAVFIPSLSLTARRLHDIGRSGWLQLLVLIPFVGSFILLYFTIQPSQLGTNQYGSCPYDLDKEENCTENSNSTPQAENQ